MHYSVVIKVTDDIAPSYSQIIKNPMDFSTIQSKLANFIYRDLTELDADVNLIVSNCLSYNGPVGYFSEVRDYQLNSLLFIVPLFVINGQLCVKNCVCSGGQKTS
jgi:hypothetical protein